MVLTMVSRGVDPVGRESAMLRIAVVQSDSRVCDPLSNSTGIGALPYWWQSIMMNAQWASQRGENVIPANTLLSITADTQTQHCRRAFCPIVRHPRRTLHRLHSILAGAPTV